MPLAEPNNQRLESLGKEAHKKSEESLEADLIKKHQARSVSSENQLLQIDLRTLEGITHRTN